MIFLFGVCDGTVILKFLGGVGVSIEYPITGYNFYYVRKSTGVKKKLTLGNVLTLVLNTSTPNLIPNSFPNGDYIVYVRAKTANGEGEISSTLTITKV